MSLSDFRKTYPTPAHKTGGNKGVLRAYRRHKAMKAQARVALTRGAPLGVAATGDHTARETRHGQ